MILEKKMQMNLQELRKQFDELQKNNNNDFFDEEGGSIIEIINLLQVYNSAMKEISTKLEILDEEFHLSHVFNPIHHLECRIKSVKSIYDKIKKYNLPSDILSIREHINDIAGIRVICNYIDDIYLMERLLINQQDVKLIKRKDYIENPKNNGYRSLHIVVKIPVFLSNRVEYVPVEIQMRTAAMDYWASLEHSLRYKNNGINMDEYSTALLECANTLFETEKTMLEIKNDINK